MQAALTADGDGALVVWMAPIVAGNDGESEEWLAHPLGIALWQRIEEENAVKPARLVEDAVL